MHELVANSRSYPDDAGVVLVYSDVEEVDIVSHCAGPPNAGTDTRELAQQSPPQLLHPSVLAPPAFSSEGKAGCKGLPEGDDKEAGESSGEAEGEAGGESGSFPPLAVMSSIKDDDTLRLLSVHGPDRTAGMGVGLKCYEAKKETPRLVISGVGGLPAGANNTNYYINVRDQAGNKAWTFDKMVQKERCVAPKEWANSAACMCDMLADQVEPLGAIASTFAVIARRVRQLTPHSLDASVYPSERAQMLHEEFNAVIPAGSAVSMFSFSGVALKKTLMMRLPSSHPVFFEPSEDWVIYHIFVRTVLFQPGGLQVKHLVNPATGWRRGIGQSGVSLDAITMKELRESSILYAQLLKHAGEVHIVSAEIKQALADLWAYDVEEAKPRAGKVQVLHTLECRLLALETDQLNSWAGRMASVAGKKAAGKRLAKIQSLLLDVAGRTTLTTGQDVLNSPCKPPCCLAPSCSWCLRAIFALHPQTGEDVPTALPSAGGGIGGGGGGGPGSYSSGAAASSSGAAASSSGAAASSSGAAASSSGAAASSSGAAASSYSSSGATASSASSGGSPLRRGRSVSLATLSLASVLDAICPGGPLAPAATVGWGALVVWGVLLLLVATLTVLAWCGCRGTLVPHKAILANPSPPPSPSAGSDGDEHGGGGEGSSAHTGPSPTTEALTPLARMISAGELDPVSSDTSSSTSATSEDIEPDEAALPTPGSTTVPGFINIWKWGKWEGAGPSLEFHTWACEVFDHLYGMVFPGKPQLLDRLALIQIGMLRIHGGGYCDTQYLLEEAAIPWWLLEDPLHSLKVKLRGQLQLTFMYLLFNRNKAMARGECITYDFLIFRARGYMALLEWVTREVINARLLLESFQEIHSHQTARAWTISRMVAKRFRRPVASDDMLEAQTSEALDEVKRARSRFMNTMRHFFRVKQECTDLGTLGALSPYEFPVGGELSPYVVDSVCSILGLHTSEDWLGVASVLEKVGGDRAKALAILSAAHGKSGIVNSEAHHPASEPYSDPRTSHTPILQTPFSVLPSSSDAIALIAHHSNAEGKRIVLPTPARLHASTSSSSSTPASDAMSLDCLELDATRLTAGGGIGGGGGGGPASYSSGAAASSSGAAASSSGAAASSSGAAASSSGAAASSSGAAASSSGAAASSSGAAASSSGAAASSSGTSTCGHSGGGCSGGSPLRRGRSVSLATLSLASVLDAICPGGPLAPAATVEWGVLVVRLDALYPGAPLAPASTVGWGALVVWGVLLLLVATLTVLAWCGCRGTLVPHQAILDNRAAAPGSVPPQLLHPSVLAPPAFSSEGKAGCKGLPEGDDKEAGKSSGEAEGEAGSD